MNWEHLKNNLQKFYTSKGLSDCFEEEEKYLRNSFYEMEELWNTQFDRIEKVNYVMFSESPLWGNQKKYLYNAETRLSQFFYKSDLEVVLGKKIKHKDEFLNILTDIGFIILDVSPFVLNEKDTSINYRRISPKDYKSLVDETLKFYVTPKLSRIKDKLGETPVFFFRYTRVQNLFSDLLSKELERLDLISSESEILEISQNGGGIHRGKFKKIINNSSINTNKEDTH